MKVRKMFCMMLVTALTFSFPVMAAENESPSMVNCTHEDEGKIVFCDESDIELANFDVAGDIDIVGMTMNVDIAEMDNILPQVNTSSAVTAGASTYGLTADEYEPNNTVGTAYNYALIPEMSGNLYNNGFKTANLHTVDDEDWYYTTLTAGNIYFLDLRNIGSTPNFNISLFYFNNDNTFDYLTSIGDTRFTGQPEKYYYFEPTKSGRYYVCVSGDGVNVSSMNYFFYIGDVQRTFDYTGYVGTPIQVMGNSYQTGKSFDLSGTVVPKDSIVLSMSFSNSFSGTTCSECQKKLVAEDGKTYYSSSSGGTEILNIARYQYLDQTWSLSARCTSGIHVTKWTPRITARYSCVMQPYPGNEVN